LDKGVGIGFAVDAEEEEPLALFVVAVVGVKNLFGSWREKTKKLTINSQRKKEFSIRTKAKATHNLTWLEQKKKRIEKMMETCPAFSSGNLFVLIFALI